MAEMGLGIKPKACILKSVIKNTVVALGQVKCPPNLCLISNGSHSWILKERALRKGVKQRMILSLVHLQFKDFLGKYTFFSALESVRMAY